MRLTHGPPNLNKSMLTAIEVAITGIAIAIVVYWLAVLFGRVGTNRSDFQWWVKVVIIQGVIVAVALKLLHII